MKALIIEDESLIAKALQQKITEVADDLEVIEILPSLKTARQWFANNSEPDMIFMDIQLSDGVSFELFDTYELKCPVVFTTAYDQYALRAFKVNGVDYLLKPINADELKKAVDKCRTIVDQKNFSLTDIHQFLRDIRQGNPTALYKEKFIVNYRHTWIPVNVSDIACFVREHLNYLFTFAGDKYILDFTTLDEIEELLDPKKFYRANRQYIINVDAVQSVKAYDNAKLKVKLISAVHQEVDISREKAPGFKKWLER